MNRLMMGCLGILLFSLMNTVLAVEIPGMTSPQISLADISGKEIQFPATSTDVCPAEVPANSKFQVLMFVGLDCPIANFYLPEWKRLESEFSKQGFDFICVHVLPDVTNEKAKAHQQDYKVESPVVLDPEGKLVKLTGVKVLSEVVILDQAGQIWYRGRINDQYIGPGKKRIAATTHDLKNALGELSQHKTVSISRTNAVGCYIEKFRK